MQNCDHERFELKQPLRILHVEDCSADRELVAAALRAEGLNFEIVGIATEQEFHAAWKQTEFDLVLSDFTMPAFDGTVALATTKAFRPEVPFVFVSGTIGEERAVDALRAGATDCVLKDRLGRLGPTVRRALGEARERADRLRAELHTRRLHRTYVVLSAINQLIVRGGECEAVLDGACRIAVEKGGFRKAWVGLLDGDGRLQPATAAGASDDPLDTANFDFEEASRHTGLGGKALLTGRHQVCNNLKNDGFMEPWCKTALARGCHAAAAFPLKVSGKITGVLALYAAEPDFFDADELQLLNELVGDIAFAIESCEREQERQRTLEQLRASEERFRELAETVQEVFWITNPAKSRMLYVSPAYERIWGRSCQSLYDTPGSWLNAIHPEDRERVRLAAQTQQEKGAYDEEYRILRPDQQIRWIRDTAFPVRNAAGTVERVVGVARDVTDRRQMAEQLRQSQKMEAIGLLAGGIAHDFNNILAAVLLQAQVSADIKNTPKEVQEGLHQIRAAAERAADLIRQLLLFSRKQVMQARDLDLNEAVTSLAKMLQRIIGEDIRLQLHLHPAPLITRADPGMLDQVLVNLAVNSRDAMPGGGLLLVGTTEKTLDDHLAVLHPDAAPGRYVCLTVTDNGMGISPEIMPRIFEPFFTTKEQGKGTGLGLATVFGIVKQHNGFIEVDSQPAQGASFRIFLPASESPPECLDRVKPPWPQGGTETILLVEDDASVRSLTRIMLERHGYHILEAADGVEAFTLWERNRETVALLLTDLVLPGGLSGLELAGSLQKDNPQLKTIFTSGYGADVARQQVELLPGKNFLQKPFSPAQLLENVRQRLDE